VGRENQQQTLMAVDGFIDLLIELSAALDVVRRKPAAHPIILQMCIQAFGKLLLRFQHNG
jgi:hypothetical protein